MAFPTSPTIGQQHIEYGDTYTWNGSIWTAGGAAVLIDGRVVYIDEVQPSDTSEGAIWYRLDLSAIATKRSAIWNNIIQSRSIGQPWTEGAAEPEPPAVSGPGQFTVTTDKASYDEGETIYVTVTNNGGGPDGMYNYTVTGIDSADIVEGESDTLIGTWPEAGGGGNFGFKLSNDVTTEGSESFTFTVDETGDSVTVSINDTSLTPVAPAGTISLRTRRPTVNEGASARQDVYIDTTGLLGNIYTWSLSGVTAEDIYNDGHSTGSFTISTDPQTTSVQLRFKGADGVENETCTFIINETGDSISFAVNDNPGTL